MLMFYKNVTDYSCTKTAVPGCIGLPWDRAQMGCWQTDGALAAKWTSGPTSSQKTRHASYASYVEFRIARYTNSACSTCNELMQQAYRCLKVKLILKRLIENGLHNTDLIANSLEGQTLEAGLII